MCMQDIEALWVFIEAQELDLKRILPQLGDYYVAHEFRAGTHDVFILVKSNTTLEERNYIKSLSSNTTTLQVEDYIPMEMDLL